MAPKINPTQTTTPPPPTRTDTTQSAPSQLHPTQRQSSLAIGSSQRKPVKGTAPPRGDNIQMKKLGQSSAAGGVEAAEGSGRSNEVQEVATPERVFGVSLAKTPDEFQLKLDQQKQKHADIPALVESMKNSRPTPHDLMAEDASGKIGDMLKATPKGERQAALKAWRNALGRSDAEIDAMVKSAKQGGYNIPTSGTFFNVINYGAIPFAGLATGYKPKFGLAGVVGSIFAQVPTTAAVQTANVAAVNVMRQKAAPTAKNASNLKIKDQKKLLNEMQALERSNFELKTTVDGMLNRYAAELNIDITGFSEEQMLDFVAELPDDKKAEIGPELEKAQAAGRKVAEILVESYIDKFMSFRQEDTQMGQRGPRVARAMSGLFPIAMRAMGCPSWSIAVVGTAHAGAALAAQHFMAGADEVTALDDEDTMNMMFADIYTEEGKQRYLSGEEPQESDIDPKKADGLTIRPETQIKDRMKALVTIHRDQIQTKMDKARAGQPDLEEGGSLIELGEQLARANADLAVLESGKLVVDGEVKLHPRGYADKLFKSAMEDTSVLFARKEASAKLQSAREYSGQNIQRGSQQIYGGLPVLFRSGVSTAAGGLDKISVGGQLGVVGAMTAFGLFSAMTQYTHVNEKNRFREKSVDALTAIGRSSIAPITAHKQTTAAGNTLASARKAMPAVAGLPKSTSNAPVEESESESESEAEEDVDAITRG